jgi:NTP pyrophosphatase (non-canonical NTP hydrolase)
MAKAKKIYQLKDLQRYIDKMVIKRGFENETISELFMLLLEEAGELAKAARKTAGIKIGKHSDEFHVAHEAADVFIYLLEICNKLNIDLEKAFWDKEAINNKRVWK